MTVKCLEFQKDQSGSVAVVVISGRLALFAVASHSSHRQLGF